MFPFPRLRLTAVRSLPILCGALLFCGTQPQARALTFVFEADEGTSQAAIDAFTAAGQLWSDRISDDITIRLEIGFSQLDIGVVGETSISYYALGAPTYTGLKQALAAHATSADDFSAVAHMQLGSSYSRLINHTSDNPNGANSAQTYVNSMNWVGLTQANAKVLGFALQDPDAVDGRIVFNSLYAFDFTHNAIDAGSFDFVGAAAHEIGHALGFVSGVDDIDLSDGTAKGTDYSSNMIDLFRYSAESVALGLGVQDYSADTRNKYFSVDGGTTAIASFATGTVYGDGRQASHWKDDLGIGIMDPTTGTGEQLNISATDLRAMDVIGYTIVPEPASGALLTLAGLAFAWRTRRRAASA